MNKGLKLKILMDELLKSGLTKEAAGVHSLMGGDYIFKIADSRNNIIRLLGFTREEADWFHKQSPQKAFHLAKWFKEWRDENTNSYASFEDEIKDFDRTYSIGGDKRYIDDPEEYFLLETLIEEDSFYQKVKGKSLHEIFHSDGRRASPFEIYVLEKGYPGFQFSKEKNYAWYDVGQSCEIVSAFLENCGSIGALSETGEHGEYSDFTMLSLKDEDKKPVMVATVGTAFYPAEERSVKVITNAAEKNNNFPKSPELLEYLWRLAREHGYRFARIYDASNKSQIMQSPGLDDDKVEGAGFEIINAYLGEFPEEEGEEEWE